MLGVARLAFLRQLYTAKWVDDLPAAMTRGGIDADGTLIPIGVGSTTETATAYSGLASENAVRSVFQ